MSRLTRAVSFAAVTFCAGFLLGATSPGFAQGLNHLPATTINALALPQVPMVADATPATLQPAVVRAEPLPADTAIATGDGDADYSSLSAAVAAQDQGLADRELRCLAAGVYFEAKGEPLAGQFAVARTIINRTRSGRFPPSICSVLTQRGQFSFVRGGVVPSADGRAGWTTAVAVAKVAARDLWDGGADTALYFHARGVAPGWRMQKVAAIGNHVFYR